MPVGAICHSGPMNFEHIALRRDIGTAVCAPSALFSAGVHP